MDLSWCIICDKRIEDDELSMEEENNNLLYCSEGCRLKDGLPQQENTDKDTSSSSATATSATTPSIFSEIKIPQPQQQQNNNNKPSTKRLVKYHHTKSSNNNTSSFYPWIPLYRKRHQINYLLNSTNKKCGLPTVAGSPITANASLILLSTPTAISTN